MKRFIRDFDGIPYSDSRCRPVVPKSDYGTTVSVPVLSIIPVLLIEYYQRKTVNRPHQCNFRPSCSEYSRLAYIRYGLIAGTRMTKERIRHCNDFYSDWPRFNKP